MKAELRETAFDMWMACYSLQEIAEEIGYHKDSISEFLKSIQSSENATDGENRQLSENIELANGDDREFDMWMACHTQEEIAEAVDVDQKTIANWETDFRKMSENDKFLNSPDFEPPIYNVWKFAQATD